MTDDGVEHRNILKSDYYLCHRICHTIDKIVYYQHLLVSFEELLSLWLSDPFALVVGCIKNNWLKLWKKIRVRCSKVFRLLTIIRSHWNLSNCVKWTFNSKISAMIQFYWNGKEEKAHAAVLLLFDQRTQGVYAMFHFANHYAEREVIYSVGRSEE